MPERQLDYNKELRELRAQLERAAERCEEASQRELLARTATNVGKAVDADIRDETKVILFQSGRLVLLSFRTRQDSGQKVNDHCELTS
jgi:hypothetical protein